MAPYVPSDPLLDLIAAVVKVLTYGGKAGCTRIYEPAADRWTMQRMDDTLRITIRSLREGFTRPEWPTDDRGNLHFSVTCDLRKFATKCGSPLTFHSPTSRT
jgi:hypothetical protein